MQKIPIRFEWEEGILVPLLDTRSATPARLMRQGQFIKRPMVRKSAGNLYFDAGPTASIPEGGPLRVKDPFFPYAK